MMETADSKRSHVVQVSEETSKSLYFQSLVKWIARQSWLQKCSPVLLGFSQEETMKRPHIGTVSGGMAVLCRIQTSGNSCAARETTPRALQELRVPCTDRTRRNTYKDARGTRHEQSPRR